MGRADPEIRTDPDGERSTHSWGCPAPALHPAWKHLPLGIFLPPDPARGNSSLSSAENCPLTSAPRPGLPARLWAGWGLQHPPSAPGAASPFLFLLPPPSPALEPPWHSLFAMSCQGRRALPGAPKRRLSLSTADSSQRPELQHRGQLPAAGGPGRGRGVPPGSARRRDIGARFRTCTVPWCPGLLRTAGSPLL